MEDRIFLYLCRADTIDPARAAAYLTPERAARLTGRGASAHAAAGLLLRRACLDLTGRAPAHEARADTGKPFLPDEPALHFSLAHSGAWALCAAGRVPVGADLQLLRPLSDALRARFFTADERALCRVGADFVRLFCAKESYGKLTGRGLSRDDRVRARGGALELRGCTIAEPTLVPGYAAAICTAVPCALEFRVLTRFELYGD